MENMQKLLSNLICSADFEKLSLMNKGFNIFGVLNIIHKELPHSDFLGWLLNPNENHLLGDIFFKELLKNIIHTNNEYLPLIYADISDMEVIREKQAGDDGRIDIFMESKKNKTVCIIENKVWSGEGYEQLERYKQYITENYKDYNTIFIYLTPERVSENNKNYKGYIRIDYGIICNIIDKIIKIKDGNINNEILLFLNHYKEMTEEHIMGNVDFDMAAICSKIYLEHKEAIDNIVKYGRPQYFATMPLKDVLEESELFEYVNIVDTGNEGAIVCLPCGIDETVKKKLYFTDYYNKYDKSINYGYQIYFKLFEYDNDKAYFGCCGFPVSDEKYYAIKDKDKFRKSLEKEWGIKSNKYEEILYTKEPLFTLDILKAGDKEEIKAAMKKRFEEVCVPYIKKFVTAMNNADVH